MCSQADIRQPVCSTPGSCKGGRDKPSGLESATSSQPWEVSQSGASLMQGGVLLSRCPSSFCSPSCCRLPLFLACRNQRVNELSCSVILSVRKSSSCKKACRSPAAPAASAAPRAADCPCSWPAHLPHSQQLLRAQGCANLEVSICCPAQVLALPPWQLSSSRMSLLPEGGSLQAHRLMHGQDSRAPCAEQARKGPGLGQAPVPAHTACLQRPCAARNISSSPQLARGACS